VSGFVPQRQIVVNLQLHRKRDGGIVFNQVLRSLVPIRVTEKVCEVSLSSSRGALPLNIKAVNFLMSASRITTKDKVMIKNPKPLHPGVVLREVYMAEMGLNQTQLAKKCGCSPRKINEIINGKRGVSPQFAIVLESVLGTSAEMWVRMQAEYDLWAARSRAA